MTSPAIGLLFVAFGLLNFRNTAFAQASAAPAAAATATATVPAPAPVAPATAPVAVPAAVAPVTAPATEATAPATVPAASVIPTTYVTAAPVQQPMQQIAAVAAGDPYGFTAWLNATRAQYGLRAVGYDPNLSAWCSANNAQQSSRGMGHFVMGPARRQNCAMGAYANIGAMWLNSPAHRAALLDPSISWIGIAGWGAYWTFNAY